MTTPNKNDIDTRYRSMVILWIAQVMSVVMFFVVTQFVEVPEDRPENNILSFVFAGVGTFCAIISFAVRAKLLRKSVEQQDLALVQTANITGRALCEVPAILGVIERFLLPGREYLLLLLIGAVAMLLHYPRRSDLLAASYKDPSFGGLS
ncbi:MAG: hypothetical protein M3447_11570 [Acidobacteriota bacterium]|nr:hypothetical protein [Acidobacteriota bacterium]